MADSPQRPETARDGAATGQAEHAQITTARAADGSPFVYDTTRAVTRLAAPLLARLRVEGLDNIPAQGPVLIAVNHITWYDVPLMPVLVKRRVQYMAKIELFNIPLLGGFFHQLGAFPVRRGEGDRESLRTAERILSEGKILVIFPEGHRSGALHRLGEAHPGAALIALRTGAPIVPAGIAGTEKMLHGLATLGPGAPRVTIRFGKPFYLTAPGGRRTREALAEGTERVMREIATLLPPEYRGRYAPITDVERAGEASATNAADTVARV